jgi:NADH-quinone oxidoreductase subunit J
MLESVLFYLFAFLTVAAGVVVVIRRSPFESALALVASFFFLAALYAMLGAHFVAAVQLLVYAGAIMVLFIFVIMVLNLTGDEGRRPWRITAGMVAGVASALLLAVTVLWAFARSPALPAPPGDAALGAIAASPGGTVAFGTIEAVGAELFGGRFLLPFEVASMLLTVAVVGAVVLAKKDLR